MIEADIIAKARNARAFTLDLKAGKVLHCILPTPYDMEMAYARASKEPSSAAKISAAYREVIERTVTGWSGIVLTDLIGGESTESVEWSAALVPVMLDTQPQWAVKLRQEIDDRIVARSDAEDAARKNS